MKIERVEARQERIDETARRLICITANANSTWEGAADYAYRGAFALEVERQKCIDAETEHLAFLATPFGHISKSVSTGEL